MSHDNNSTYIYVSQQRAISHICSRSENDVEKQFWEIYRNKQSSMHLFDSKSI